MSGGTIEFSIRLKMPVDTVEVGDSALDHLLARVEDDEILDLVEESEFVSINVHSYKKEDSDDSEEDEDDGIFEIIEDEDEA
jgi:hypothetical protein